MSHYNERELFIEETGMLFEKLGVTRMSGRILGYLMVCDKEMVCFEELTQALQAAKSSISTNIKALIHLNYVKPKTVPGDRKTYYMLSPDINWVDNLKNRIELLKQMNSLFVKALELRVNKQDNSSAWLNKSLDFYDWVVKEYPRFLEKYVEENKT